MANRIYVYKCVYDEGGAPCIDGGILSLTICKPQIRRRAQIGDLIFAFGSNSETPPNRLVYVARVTQRVPDGEYYCSPRFSERGDCIYRQQRNGMFVRRRDANFHTKRDHRPRDLGLPPIYSNAIALVSDDFRYFGANGTDDWKSMAPRLRQVVEGLKRGHRVNHCDAVAGELLSLNDFVRRTFRRKVNGLPLHGQQQPDKCNACVRTRC